MADTDARAAETSRSVNRIVIAGAAVIALILVIGAIMFFVNFPDSNAFNSRIEQIFVEYDLTSAEGDTVEKLLGIMAESGTTFGQVITSYRIVIFILMIFSLAMLLAALVFIIMVIALNRRIREIERAGIQVSSLVISRDARVVSINNMDFSLTPAAIETLAVLAEARMDEEVLTGAEIEAMISGKNAADCDEASGATRIKRLRDALGNQMVSELLVKNIQRRGYMLDIEKDVIRMI